MASGGSTETRYKKLAVGEVRFVVYDVSEPRKPLWRVYDRVNGSFPIRTPEFGEVVQDAPRADCEAECVRLNELVGSATEEVAKTKPSAKTATKRSTRAPKPTATDLEIEVTPLEDYGISAEAAKKMEESLF